MRSSGLRERPVQWLVVGCLALTLAACKDDGNPRGRRGQSSSSDSDLPAPEARGGSITGMPDAPGPGQGNAPIDGMVPPDTPIASDGSLGPPPIGDGSMAGAGAQAFPGMGEGAPEGMPPPTSSDEPSAQEAVAVVGEYYGAINARQFGQAYALWADAGRSSGQSPEQFADGFAETAGVSVEIDTPGRIDAAAGSRYVEVPVSISATRRDGSVQRYVGIYTLRRAMADGASAEQRMWRISSADLREVRP